MRSPFDDLGKTRVSDPQGEEVEGTFGCQTKGCFSMVQEARYLSEVKIVTWECKEGHINRVEYDLGD